MGRRFTLRVAVKKAVALRPEFAALLEMEKAAQCGLTRLQWTQITHGYLKRTDPEMIAHLCKGLEMDMATFLQLGGMSEEKVEVLVPGTKLSGIAGGSGQDDVDTGGKVVAMRRKAKVKSVANQHLKCEPEAVAA